MTKRFIAALLLCASVLTPIGARADVPIVTQSGTISATGATPPLLLSGQSICTTVVSGSFTGLSMTPQGSADGSTYSNNTALSNGSPIIATGTYSGSVAYYPRAMRFNVTAITSGSVTYVVTCSGASGSAITPNGNSQVSVCSSTTPNCVFAVLMPANADAVVPGSTYGFDVRSSQMTFNGTNWDRLVQCPNSQSVAISSATTTQLVAASGSTRVYVCGFFLTATGTTPTLQFEYGTGASCGTGTTTLSGALAPTAGSPLSQGVGLGYLFRTPASQALCLVSGGTPSIQGVLYYAQF